MCCLNAANDGFGVVFCQILKVALANNLFSQHLSFLSGLLAEISLQPIAITQPLLLFSFVHHLAVSNVASFQLPDPKGQAGGALTSAMLNVLYKDHQNSAADLTFKDALLAIRAILKQGSYSQTPQLSSSRPMDIGTTFDLAPEKYTGTRRAVMIGYVLGESL